MMSWRSFLRKVIPDSVIDLLRPDPSSRVECEISDRALLAGRHNLAHCRIGAYSYLADQATVSYARIGKFCSIGPNFLCGYGIHPTAALSTAPMFYSTAKQNGTTLCERDKMEERREIVIGNDVFIGANVTILDGVTIGDGAIIGACALVNRDVPPYAIVGGVPAKLIRYRLPEAQIKALLAICWWDFPDEKLVEVERYFDDIDGFIRKYQA